MTILVGFIIVMAVIGAVVGLLNGGKLRDIAAGAAQGGAFGFGCLFQLVLAAIPVIGGLFVLSLLLRGCHH